MADQDPYWLKLLKHKRIVKHETGYTLPFIIGAHSYSNDLNEIDIDKLFEEIRNYDTYDTSVKFLVQWCDNPADAHILSIRDGKYGGFEDIKIVYDEGEVQRRELDEEAITVLKKLYNPKIDSRDYSKTKNGWEPFTPEDILEIKEALK